MSQSLKKSFFKSLSVQTEKQHDANMRNNKTMIKQLSYDERELNLILSSVISSSMALRKLFIFIKIIIIATS